MKQTKSKLREYGYHIVEDRLTFDVVCGMEIEQAECESTHYGETYYFCSLHCKEHFNENPMRYIGE